MMNHDVEYVGRCAYEHCDNDVLWKRVGRRPEFCSPLCRRRQQAIRDNAREAARERLTADALRAARLVLSAV